MKFFLTAALLIASAISSQSQDRALEQSYLAPVVPPELLKHARLEIPSLENIEIVGTAANPILELRMLPGQKLTNKGNRAEISVDFPFEEGDTVVYEWRLRIPADSGTDAPQNRWWLLAQWHDQPDARIGENWDGYTPYSPTISLGYGVIDGQDRLSVTYGAPDQTGITHVALSRDVWHDVTAEIHWSTSGDGWAKFYLDDPSQPFAQAEGANMMNSYQHYLKLGSYRHPDIQVFSQIHLDALRIHISSQ